VKVPFKGQREKDTLNELVNTKLNMRVDREFAENGR